MVDGLIVLFFFFKQKTAYELRISDWSSDVCSSDLSRGRRRRCRAGPPRWAGEDKDFGMAMRLVHEAMERAGPDAGHDAHFICALSLAWPDGHIESFEG